MLASFDGFRDQLSEQAKALGFAAVGISPAQANPQNMARLQSFLKDGRHGDMLWMQETVDRRASPEGLWPHVRSVIMLGMNYGPALDPLRHAGRADRGVISVYALGSDYHDLIKKRLKALAGWVAGQTASDVKVFVDTAPVMEKPLAARAGLGWQGKHSNLVSRTFGNWLFLGAIYTTADLPTDDAGETDYCGSCSRCMQACPTDAIFAPYQVDARRCISYLTIEHKGPIGHVYRKAMGNRIYGCDDCLAVCPWNKYAQVTGEPAFRPRVELAAPLLADFLALDDDTFRSVFAGSPVKRIGRDRFVRNCLIAAGNSEQPDLLPVVASLLDDASAVVRGAAVWAFGELALPEALEKARARYALIEADSSVLEEWEITGRPVIRPAGGAGRSVGAA